MMTPVYDVAIANWKINNWSKHQHAARLDTSAFSTPYGLHKALIIPIVNSVICCCSKYLRKHFNQRAHLDKSETIEDFRFPQNNHPKQKSSLDKYEKSIRKIVHQKHKNHLYSSRVHPITYYTFINCGKDMLWQLTSFELMAPKVRLMSLTATPKSNRRLSAQPPLTRRSNAA